VIDHLIDLALKRPWLREPSANALCTLVTAIPSLADGAPVADHLSKALDEKGLVRSQDGAAVILTLQSLPRYLRPKISSKFWQHGDPLHPDNLGLLNKVLREMQSEEDSVKSTGSFKSEPHFVWMLILQRYQENTKDIVPLKTLWENVVESIIPLSSALGKEGSNECRWIVRRFVIIGEKVPWIPIVSGTSSSDFRGIGPCFVYFQFPSVSC